VSHNPQEQGKALLNRAVCYQCAFPISDPHAQSCPRCGSSDIDARHARPHKKTHQREAPPLPHPWSQLRLEHSGTVILSGNAGSGKTTICLKAKPTKFLSSEQELEKVQQNWWRVVGNHEENAKIPLLSSISSWDQLEEDLIDLDEDDVVVVDSISQLAAPHHAAAIVARVIERIRVARARAFFIAQFTKDGDMLGPNELRHLVDVVGKIPDDPTGLRRLSIEKNRYGSPFSQYFGLDAHGVTNQNFPYCYTVEGSANKFRLHLYPMTGGPKLTGIFDDFAEQGIRVLGCASAAIKCGLYPGGYAEPPDVEWRKRFAQAHGLTWIDAAAAREILSDTAAFVNEDTGILDHTTIGDPHAQAP
jgi:hypothetical protein